MARGHVAGAHAFEPALRDVPAGGLTASVLDLAAFARLQFTDAQAVLPAGLQAEMLRRQNAAAALDADTAVGLG